MRLIFDDYGDNDDNEVMTAVKGDSWKFECCPLKVNQAMVIGGDDDDNGFLS